jgi:hypothetical protein
MEIIHATPDPFELFFTERSEDISADYLQQLPLSSDERARLLAPDLLTDFGVLAVQRNPALGFPMPSELRMTSRSLLAAYERWWPTLPPPKTAFWHWRIRRSEARLVPGRPIYQRSVSHAFLSHWGVTPYLLAAWADPASCQGMAAGTIRTFIELDDANLASPE